jgi:DNA-binding Xre family transcriptional regulator
MSHFDCGKRLCFLQDDKKISSVQLSDRMDVTPQQLVRWRQQPNLKIHTVERICAGLGIGLAEFFTWPIE